MKAYKRKLKFDHEYEYPEDMKRILDYLNDHGDILVDGRVIEELYRDFSDYCYCAGWMCVDNHILEEFEEWLNNREVYFCELD